MQYEKQVQNIFTLKNHILPGGTRENMGLSNA